MKNNNWKYWISLQIKHGIIGKILLKYFNYVFPLSEDEISYKYPNMKNEFTDMLYREFGNDIKVKFVYSIGKSKCFVDIFYSRDCIETKYGSFCPLPNIFFNQRKPTQKDMEWIKNRWNEKAKKV